MKRITTVFLAAFLLVILTLLMGLRFPVHDETKPPHAEVFREKSTESDRMVAALSQRVIEEGKRMFRLATFGGRTFWRNAFRSHKATPAMNVDVRSASGPKTESSAGLQAGKKVSMSNRNANLKRVSTGKMTGK